MTGERAGENISCVCVIVLRVVCSELSGMLDTAGNDSSSHRDANCAADALMLLLRGRSSSSNRVAHSSLSNCAIAADFAFARRWSLISGGSKMG